jgi:hypothetical protein
VIWISSRKKFSAEIKIDLNLMIGFGGKSEACGNKFNEQF